VSQRPRGFVQRWNPRAETLALLEKVTGILAEYVRQSPLTIRQIFYRLVGRHGFEKTELVYSRLGETLNKARRARIADMDAIRDDGFTATVPDFYGSANHFFATIQISAQSLRLDRQKGQHRRLALWCEAGGMVPQLARIADPYGIAVYSSGGFDSLTDKHRLAAEWAGERVTVLHIGDHDPSGIHVFSSLSEDISAFARAYGNDGDIEFLRVAVTPAQAICYRLEAAPPKPTDRRRFEGNETWQAEALDPRDLAAIVGAKGAAWATLPSKPQLAAGRHKLDANGRRLYVPVVEWITKDLRDRFSQAVVELVLAEHPSALDGEGGQ
jgi:hypothetical protein